MSKKLYGLMAVLMIAVMTLSACGGGGGEQVEVFSWWTGGGEASNAEVAEVIPITKMPIANTTSMIVKPPRSR